LSRRVRCPRYFFSDSQFVSAAKRNDLSEAADTNGGQFPFPVQNTIAALAAKEAAMKRFVTSALVMVLVSAVSANIAHAQKLLKSLSRTSADMLRYTNDLRRENGVRPPLVQSPKLDEVARRYARLMAEKEQMSHSLDGQNAEQRMLASGYSAAAWAENIASHSEPDRTKAAFAIWANSQSHRANMLNRQFTEMGSGYVISKSGKCYYCQVFAKPRPSRLPPPIDRSRERFPPKLAK
jgi:uncharacterized protein YkwD